MKILTIALILIIAEILLKWFNQYVTMDEKIKRVISIVVIIVVVAVLIFARFGNAPHIE